MLVLLLNAFGNRGNCHWASNNFIPALATLFEAGSWHRQNRETETVSLSVKLKLVVVCFLGVFWGVRTVFPGELNHLLRLLQCYCLTHGHVCGDVSIRLFNFFLFDFSLGGIQPLSQVWCMDLLTLVSTVHIGWV